MQAPRPKGKNKDIYNNLMGNESEKDKKSNKKKTKIKKKKGKDSISS